mgnify:FL=1
MQSITPPNLTEQTNNHIEIIIPSINFKKKRGRPRKNPVPNENNIKEKKKRGRPNKSILKTVDTSLTNIVNEIVEASEKNREVSVENLSKTKFAQKKSSKTSEPKKTRGRPISKVPYSNILIETDSEDEKLDVKLSPETKCTQKESNDKPDTENPKKKRGRPRKVNYFNIDIGSASEDEKSEIKQSPSVEEFMNVVDDANEYEYVPIIMDWEWKGKNYLKDEKDNVYETEFHELIGKFDGIDIVFQNIEDQIATEKSPIIPDSPPGNIDDVMVDLFKRQHTDDSFRLHNRKTKYIPEEETAALQKGTHHLVKRECWGSRKTKLINAEESLYPYVSIYEMYGDIISKEEFLEMQTQQNDDYEYCVKIQRKDQTNTNTITSYLKIARNEEHTRILNHSCQPNCCIIEQEVPHRYRPEEKEIQYILYPMKKIDFFEELTIDYGWYATTYDDLHVCDCGSSNCKRIIHKNGKMFTRNGLQYVKLENQDAIVWTKYRYLPLNHGVGARVWEFLDDLDITDLNIIRARAEYFKKCKPDNSSIIQQHSRLLQQGLKDAGLKKMPTKSKSRGRPEKVCLRSFGCGYYTDGMDEWGHGANGRPLKTILYYIKNKSQEYHCITMQRDENGVLFDKDGDRSGPIYIH